MSGDASPSLESPQNQAAFARKPAPNRSPAPGWTSGMVGIRQRPQRPGNADSERGISPTSARVMLETRLIEGMLLGRSAECCRSHQQRCTGLRAALQLEQLSCEVQPRGELHEMRNILVKLFIGTAITSIAMFGADNSIGTWKRNIDKSKATPPATNPITSLTIVNEAVDGGVKVTAINPAISRYT